MAIPDYRIRFPSNRIDFEEDVFAGSSDGQDINDFPEPGAQARYDWMRMVIIGLLANQSSYEEPINYKIGTLWMNLNDNFFRYFNGENFEHLANAISINDMSLVEWGELVDETVGKTTEAAFFTGISSTHHVTTISIPSDALAAAAYENNHPVTYINNILVDPRKTAFDSERTKVLLLDGLELKKNDIFTVLIQRLDKIVADTV